MSQIDLGTVFWITGLSGSGKTTIGRLFYERLRASRSNVVFLDGDILRDVFGSDLGHSLDDRMVSAMRNARLCQMLSSQGIDVVCATISMFHECQDWNRANIPHYREIYLRVPIDILMARDQKQLYRLALDGKITEVMGVDIKAEEPRNPDFVVENGAGASPDQIAEELYSHFKRIQKS